MHTYSPLLTRILCRLGLCYQLKAISIAIISHVVFTFPNMTRLRLTPVSRSINSIRFSPRTTFQSIYGQQRRLYAGSSYGGGEGDPKGENPQDQGSNPSADLEHPGPPPPDVGKGTGGGPTKSGGDGHNTKENASSGGQSTSSSGGSGGGPQPKIHNQEAPTEHSQSEEVKAHNREMAAGHDRAEEKSPDKENDKVKKGFWSGKRACIPGNDFSR